MVNISIWGGNASEAQKNITCSGCNNTINVSAWNVSYGKTVWVNGFNGSLTPDILTFNISNVTAYQIIELKINGTVRNGYQAGANGMVNFTHYAHSGNMSFSIAPAVNVNGYNMTWAKIWHGINFDVQGKSNTNASNRALSTIYQNLNQTERLITISTSANGAGTYTEIMTGTTNPPNERVCYMGTNVAGPIYVSCTFLVLPGWFYHAKITGAPSLLEWVEWSKSI